MSELDVGDATLIRTVPFVGTDRILVADADHDLRGWFRWATDDQFGVEEVDTAYAAYDRLQAAPPRVLVVGSALRDAPGAALLEAAARHQLVAADRGPVVLLLSRTVDSAPVVNEALVPIFYRLLPGLAPERLRELLHHAMAPNVPSAPSHADAVRKRRILDHAQRLGALQDTARAATAAIAAVVDVLRADRAQCLYYDDETGDLWAEPGDDVVKASVGVAGFAARTGVPVVLETAAADPAYHGAIDDPAGVGSERIAAQPVIDRDQRVHAVLVAVRGANRPPFSPVETGALAELAAGWAPFVQQLALEGQLASEPENTGDDLFRQEAIENMVRRGHRGDVVRVHPGWINATLWVVLVAAVAAAVFAAFARVHQYTSGPAVVRVTGRSEVIAYDGGSVTSIEVAAGQRVTRDQLLVRLHDVEQSNRVRALDSELERKLVAYLQTPSDPNVRQSLSALVAERDSSTANLDARAIRAPHDGIVREVLVNVGQRLEPGRIAVAIARDDGPEQLSVVAFLPGGDRPRVHAGQALRLTLPGYRGAVVQSTVRAISAEVMGVADARARYLGARLGDSVPLAGSVVVVEAQLPATFDADGQRYDLHDGMVGHGEVQLESRTVLETILPLGSE